MLTATACMFTRTAKEKWEYGIAVITKGPGISDVDIIIDTDGNPVSADGLWNYKLMGDLGSFTHAGCWTGTPQPPTTGKYCGTSL